MSCDCFQSCSFETLGLAFEDFWPKLWHPSCSVSICELGEDSPVRASGRPDPFGGARPGGPDRGQTGAPPEHGTSRVLIDE